MTKQKNRAIRYFARKWVQKHVLYNEPKPRVKAITIVGKMTEREAILYNGKTIEL
jgi:hypothetical protein